MNWLFRLLFPNVDTTVRINRGNLPGLKAPTAAPRIAHRRKTDYEQSPNIEHLYARYKASHPNKPKKRNQDERGVGF